MLDYIHDTNDVIKPLHELVEFKSSFEPQPYKILSCILKTYFKHSFWPAHEILIHIAFAIRDNLNEPEHLHSPTSVFVTLTQ